MALAASSLAIRMASAAAGWPARCAAMSRRTWAAWSARPWNVRWYHLLFPASRAVSRVTVRAVICWSPPCVRLAA